MPELPEVERLRQTLEPHLLGRRIERARLLRHDICACHAGATGRPAAPRPARLLLGATIGRTCRRGKQLALVASDGRTLCIHLGMSGQVLVVSTAAARALSHVHARWTLRGEEPRVMVFRDPRRFGGLWTFDTPDALLAVRWGTLGPDALTISGDALSAALRGRRTPIKAALLDQACLAGVGNIYADEALFAAGIHPRIPARRLSAPDTARLADAVRRVLRSAIRRGGSTLRDYLDADGRAGDASAIHAVYGRSGKPCTVCSGILRSAVVAQRTTVWCPACQSSRGPRR